MQAINNETLTADLRVFRGGNKARLVARCYVALMCHTPSGHVPSEPYEAFRELHIKWTYHQLHKAYDHMLPVEHRAK